MPADLALGGLSLAIQIVDKCVKVVEYFAEKIENTKNLGEHVGKLKTRITCECARLQAFNRFLAQETENGEKKLERLPGITQDAIIGMIQELEMLFWSYSQYVEQQSITELQRGYANHKVLEQTPEQIVEGKKQERKEARERFDWRDAAKWAFSDKKRITNLVQEIEEWNNRMMGLLLVGICYGEPLSFSARERPILDTLRLTTGLKLRALLEESSNTATPASLILKKASLKTTDVNNRVQTLEIEGDNGQKTSEHVFVEFKQYELPRRATNPSVLVVGRIEKLAQLLAHKHAADAGFRTLQCIAVVQQPALKRFSLAFRLPNDTSSTSLPLTLQDAIASKTTVRPTLNQRFAMAVCLSQTLFELHSVQWLHKGIRSDNILFGWEPADDAGTQLKPKYTNPYLAGFEFSREQNDRSTTEQDDRLERQIYRHPDRQGLPADSPKFTVLHDIYSLGVVLLEIGLWRPVCGFEDYSETEPGGIRRSLQEHTRQRLPHYMGEAYTKAVMKCLKGDISDTVAGTLAQTNPLEQELKITLAFSQDVTNSVKGCHASAT